MDEEDRAKTIKNNQNVSSCTMDKKVATVAAMLLIIGCLTRLSGGSGAGGGGSSNSDRTLPTTKELYKKNLYPNPVLVQRLLEHEKLVQQFQQLLPTTKELYNPDPVLVQKMLEHEKLARMYIEHEKLARMYNQYEKLARLYNRIIGNVTGREDVNEPVMGGHKGRA